MGLSRYAGCFLQERRERQIFVAIPELGSAYVYVFNSMLRRFAEDGATSSRLAAQAALRAGCQLLCLADVHPFRILESIQSSRCSRE